MLHAAGSRRRALLAPPHMGSVFHGRISAASRAAGPASPPASVSSGSEEQLSQRCWVCQNPTRSCLSCSIWALSQHEGPPPPPPPGPLRWEQAKKESCFPKHANRHGANKTSRTVLSSFTLLSQHHTKLGQIGELRASPVLSPGLTGKINPREQGWSLSSVQLSTRGSRVQVSGV